MKPSLSIILPTPPGRHKVVENDHAGQSAYSYPTTMCLSRMVPEVDTTLASN